MSRINTLDAPDFLYWVQSVYGKHVFGTNESAKDAPDDGDLDGSTMTSWAANQVGSFLPGGASSQAQFCFDRSLMLPVSVGLVTRGALLWTRYSVAVSLGDGKRTVEPLGRMFGVRINGAASPLSSRWVLSAQVPAVRY